MCSSGKGILQVNARKEEKNCVANLQDDFQFKILHGTSSDLRKNRKIIKKLNF
jgi:hypothetical protein